MHGSHLQRAYTKTQQSIAPSSSEAEYYSIIRAVSEAMGIQAMAKDSCKELARLYVDATAAMGVAQRIGLGKVCHLETQSLWLQQAVPQRRLGMAKVMGVLNPADAMTKAVDSVTLERLLGLMGLERRSGRAAIAPLMEDAEVSAVESIEDVRLPSTTSSAATSSSRAFVHSYVHVLACHVCRLLISVTPSSTRWRT